DNMNNLFGLLGKPVHKQGAESIENMDEALSNLVNSGNLEAAAAGFQEAVDAGAEVGLSVEEVAAAMPQYIHALESMASEQGVALEGTELYEAALGNLPPELKAVADAADEAAQQDALVGALEDVGLAADGTV